MTIMVQILLQLRKGFVLVDAMAILKIVMWHAGVA